MQKYNRPFQKVLNLISALVIVFTMFSCNFMNTISSTGTPNAISTLVVTPDPQSTILPKTATATLVKTAAALLSPTGTPPALSTVTPTATIAFSPTPTGFYRQSNAGFSLTYPSDWEIADESHQQLVLADRSSKTMLVFFSFPEKTTLTKDLLKDQVQNEMGSGYTVKVQKTSEGLWADQVKPTKLETLVEGPKGSFILWVYYAHTGERGYMVFVVGDQNLSYRQQAFNAILATLRTFKPVLYDLPHDQTLTLLGGIPVDQYLDPATTGSSAGGYVGLLFSGLVRLTPELQIVPELADHWVISPDGMEYTFTLRKDLKFSSGNPITAQDFKDSWERAADPQTKSTTASTYLGDIAGFKEKQAGKAKDISGVKVVDAQTLQVTLDGAKPYFLAKLTYPTGFVIDVHQVKRDPKGWMFSPISSGPYKVRKYIENEALIFEANPQYWKQPGIPYLIYLFQAGGSAMSLYEEGTIDMVYPPLEELGQIKQADHPLNKELITTPSMCTSMIMLNPDQPPLDDPLVRKALWLATDRDAWSEKITHNTAIVDDSILPPAMPGYQADRSIGKFDPAAAKAALSKSKYAGQTLQITLTVAGYAGDAPLGITLLTGMWAKNLGIQVKVEFLDPVNFNEQALKKKDTQVMLYGWCADYPDPENFLDVLFYSKSQFNLWQIKLPELDAVLEKGRTEADPVKRLAYYQQAEDMLLNQYDVIPQAHSVISMLVKTRVKNFVLASMDTSIIPLLTLEER